MRLTSFITRPRGIKKRDPNDPQKNLVYSAERELIGMSIHTHCDKEHLRAIVRHACNKYKVHKPVFKIISSEKRIFGSCDEDGITLNSKFHGDNVATLVHELAHWITDHFYTRIVEDHGPEFVGVWSELLSTYKLIPDDAIAVMLDRYGLEIAY